MLWIHSELDSLPAELLRGRFDLVYAGPQTTQNARDLEHFASTVGSALRPGGDLLLFDEHPAALCIDGLMHWREDYFAQGFRRLGQLVGALGPSQPRRARAGGVSGGAGLLHDARVPESFLLHARKAR